MAPVRVLFCFFKRIRTSPKPAAAGCRRPPFQATSTRLPATTAHQPIRPIPSRSSLHRHAANRHRAGSVRVRGARSEDEYRAALIPLGSRPLSKGERADPAHWAPTASFRERERPADRAACSITVAVLMRTYLGFSRRAAARPRSRHSARAAPAAREWVSVGLGGSLRCVVCCARALRQVADSFGRAARLRQL